MIANYKKKAVVLFCLALLLSMGVFANEEKIEVGKFGNVTLYYNPGKIHDVVLFISGDGGWNMGVVNMARRLQEQNALVAGVDIIKYEKALLASKEKCIYPAADFEMLSKYIQKKLDLPTYTHPIVVGYSSGATLAYALVSQAPVGTFKGAVSMGFCPDLPVAKQWCKGVGLKYELMSNGKGVYFLPDTNLKTPWIAFQGQIDQVCSPSVVDTFVKQIPGAGLVALPNVGHGFSIEKNWLPQFKKAIASLERESVNPVKSASDTNITTLPLTEVPASENTGDCFALLITGDGGWAGIDRSIADEISQLGIPVIGLNSLQYFWTARTPEEASHDIAKVINHFSQVLNKKRCILIGYSLGADVMPFIVSRLDSASYDRIAVVALLGISRTVDFQFHLTDWFGVAPSKDTYQVLPEILKIKTKPVLCFYGEEEQDDPAVGLHADNIHVIKESGGHHFGGAYKSIADEIIKEIKVLK
jgi:type IV secretory pathway VirJ component